MADDKKPKRLKVIKGDGGPALNKITCIKCRKTIRWYPCPRCGGRMK